MPDGNDGFDADLEAMINGTGAEQATPGAEATPTQPSESKLKYGGREWDSPEKLGKAYEALHKDYTRKSQEFSRLKPYGDFDAYLNKHPELREAFNKTWNEKLAEYQKRVEAGQSQTTAARATGLSPEQAERLERMESFFEDQKLDREINGLKTKHGLDASDMKLVLHKATELAEKNVILPLEDVFKILAFEQRQLDAKKDGEKAALDKIALKKKANIGGSDVPAVSPSAKGVHEMNSSEYDKAINDKLAGLGYSG